VISKRQGDAGDTLVEILISMTILGVCGVAVVAAMATSIFGSTVSRSSADGEVGIRRVAEQVLSTATYVPCSATTTPAYSVAPPSGLVATGPVKVEYWDGTFGGGTFQSTCPLNSDRGIQRLSISLKSTDGRGSATVSVVLRKP
jgi:type II secretory pathway pseudopilin PulG